MSEHQTGIEWTHFPGYVGATWNPYVGCSSVSPGCQHCYAPRQVWRIVVQARAAGRTTPYDDEAVEIGWAKTCPTCRGRGTLRLANAKQACCRKCWGFGQIKGEPLWTGEIYDAGKLDLPLRTKKPHTFFVCSMSDLFHERLTNEQVAAAFGVMAACPQHVFVILTKRIERVSEWGAWAARPTPLVMLPRSERLFCALAAEDAGAVVGTVQDPRAWPPSNILIGPSVEDQQRADERMPHAMKLASAGWRVVVSYEPALGPVDWRPWIRSRDKFEWLIVGAESGPRRRPFDPSWIPVAGCADAGVPLFVKQGSAHKPGQQGNIPDSIWSIKQFPRW